MSLSSRIAAYAGGASAARAYIYHRSRSGDLTRYREKLTRTPVSAATALQCARVDLIAGVERYPATGGDTLGAAFGREGLRWTERPALIGLRFVGFADELAGRGISHRGWYQDSDGSGETLRGAVYQLPGRDGRAVYVAGYCEGSFGRDGWQGMNGDSAAIAFGELFRSDPGGDQYPDSDHYGAHRDAAFRADQIAEREAESAREYNDA